GGVAKRGTVADMAKFPKYAELKARSSRVAGEERDLTESATMYDAPEAQGEVRYDPDRQAVREELSLFADSLRRSGGAHAFADTSVTAATPGIISTTLLRSDENRAYASDRDYVLGLARELKNEYESIVAAGHVLQLDAPDLAMERQIMFQHRPLRDFL